MFDGPEDDGPEDVLEEKDIDFAFAAYREEGRWIVAALPPRSGTTVDTLQKALRQLPGEGGVLGFVSIADEFFLAMRTAPGGIRGFASDGGAVLDWPIAQDLLDAVGIDFDDDELEDYSPFGDLSTLADFGLDADELIMTCEDEDLYVEDQVRAIAKRLGFGRELSDVLRRR